MSAIVLNYAHWRPSFQPKGLRREDIWEIAEAARQQVCGGFDRPQIAVARIMSRTRWLQVNGVCFELHWELEHALTDEAGNPVMGTVSHDERWPKAALVCLNGEAIGEREDLARSTAAHELGHGIFEVPSWIARRRKRHRTRSAPERRYRQVSAAAAQIDWGEWRANEFMGAFLAPRRLLRLHTHKRAAALGVPMTGGAKALPIVNGRKASAEAIEALATELAEMFGVSLPFMETRLNKYSLISGT